MRGAVVWRRAVGGCVAGGQGRPQGCGQRVPLATHPPARAAQLSASAGIFYGYVFIIGLCLWGAIRWLRGDMKLANIYCIYGGL